MRTPILRTSLNCRKAVMHATVPGNVLSAASEMKQTGLFLFLGGNRYDTWSGDSDTATRLKSSALELFFHFTSALNRNGDIARSYFNAGGIVGWGEKSIEHVYAIFFMSGIGVTAPKYPIHIVIPFLCLGFVQSQICFGNMKEVSRLD